MMPGTGSDTNLSVSLIILFGSAAIMLLPVVVFSGRVSNASYGVVELDEWGCCLALLRERWCRSNAFHCVLPVCVSDVPPVRDLAYVVV